MSDHNLTPPARFHIEVAEDRLSATLRVTPGMHVKVPEVLTCVREMKFLKADEVGIAEALSKELTTPLSLTIAKGVAPVDERPGRVLFKVPVADSSNGLIAKVESGRLIATASPPQPGSDGRDVFGKPIAPRKNALPFKLGQNISLKKDELLADIEGNVRLREGKLSVEPLLEMDGDDDAGTLLVTFEGDVAIKGSLREGRALHVGSSLVVGNAVKAASHLKVGGDAYIKGGIVGKDKAKLVIGGELRAGFVTGCSVVAGANVYSQSEVLSSRIFCSGQLLVVRGPIIGGEISANGGVVCQTIGNSAGTPTIVGAGTDRVTKSLSAVANAEADANQKKIEAMRSKITPLMEKLKSLTPEQRERVTELLYNADELESKNNSMLAELAKRSDLMNQRAKSEISVAEMVYPGTTIRLPGLETVITTTIQGPLKVSLRINGDSPEIILFQDASRSTIVLPSQLTADRAINKPQRVAAAA